MTRSRRSALTYTTGLLYTVITLVVGIVALPFLLGWLGEERYGAFRATVDWFGYVALLELGLSGALRPIIARQWGRNDLQQVTNAVAAGIRAFAYVAAPMIVAGLLLVGFLTFLVPVDVATQLDLRRGGLVMLAGLLLVPLTPFREFADARQAGYRINVLLLVQSLLITGTALLLAWRGWGVTGQIVATVLGSLVFFGSLALYGARRLPGVWARVFDRDSVQDAWRDLWHLNTPTLVRQIAGRLSILSGRIIVAALLGPALVVPLYVTQRLGELLQAQVTAISSATWAALAELHAQGRRDVFNERVIELTELVAVLALAALVPIVAYNEHFVARWVGINRYGGDAVIAVASANAFLIGIVTLWDWCFGGTGKVAALVPVTVVATVINVGLSLALTPALGVVGPLLGTLVAMTLTTVWYVPVLLRRHFGTSLRRLATAVAVPLGWAVPYAGLSLWFAASHDPAGWLMLLSEMAAWPLIFLSLFWFVGIRKGRRSEYAERVRSILMNSQ